MKHLYLFGLLLSLPFFGFSQGEWNNWYFGWQAAMTFNFGDPIAIGGSWMGQSASGTSTTVSDSSGTLLYCSNGLGVFDITNWWMPNGNGILGGNLCQQPVFSVPTIGNNHQYYLFTVGEPAPSNPPYTIIGLHYSIIDMSLRGGLGDVVVGMKNIVVPFGDSAVDQLTGIRHKNNKDVWIVVRKHGLQTKYLAYLVNASGISSSPVISSSNLPTRFRWNSGVLKMKRGGDMKISQDGTKLVCTDSLTEICGFNAQTGVVTPKFLIYTSDSTSGAEFSVDSKYLYLCMTGSNVNPYLHLGWQFDMSWQDSSNFIQHEIMIGNGFGSKLQLSPNWKIYTGANTNIDSLNCINNPSSPGFACNYQRDAVYLGNMDNSCLVQFLQRYKAYINHSGQCQNQDIHFLSDIWPPPDSIHWDFGDPASGSNNFSNLVNPSHTYSTIGNYTVELFVRHNDNRTDTSWQTITIVASPQVALGPDRTICLGDSTTFDAGICSGCTYLWKDIGSGLTVGTSQTLKTGQAGTYEVTVTNSNGCNGKDTVHLATTPVPLVTNNPLSKSICSGESTNIPLASNVAGTNFHWTASLTSGNITGFSADSGLVINQILTNSLPTPGVVTYHITPKIGSCIGATVDFPVTVIPGDSVKVSITASANNICAGTTVTFTATPTKPGLTPVYQWKVNGINVGTNSTTFSYSPLNNDIVTCVLTSSLTVCISNNPATSNSIVMVVIPNLPVSITISPDANPVCAGSSVTFTAYPVFGGLTPSYQWKVNGINSGTNSQFFTYTPINGDLVSCILTSSETCTTNNPASSIQHQVTVSPLLPVSITISPSANPFCPGSSVTFNAFPTHGGFTPTYQWKVNGANAGTNSDTFTYNPANNDQVFCILTSSEQCTSNNPASSNIITMVENTSLPAGVTIAATSNPFCPGSSVTFTATPNNGGSLPSYQWKVNGINVGTNSITYSYNPVDGDSVRCIMTSNLSCVTNNPASSNKIIISGTLAPIVTFTSCFDTITTINAKPIKLKGGIPLGGTYSGPGVNSLSGIYTPSLAGIGTHTITYSYTNAALCTAAKSISILNLPSSILTCGNPLTDVRDNKVYRTVQIGIQCWLATNLNFGTTIASTQDQRDNCISEKYCYNDNPLNCTNQGGLYQWDEVMRFDETPANQGFCPPGWHIPTENDWNILFATFINNGFAGSPLKYSGYSGFNALLSGARHINKGWDFQGFATFFWSSTSRSDNKAWAHGMNDPDPSVSSYPSSRVNAFSVRCLKD